ncbi:MAG: 4Fe-4S ferredoxin [Bacteroidetes bacterium]|nr:4Fe-4S ferredoxin [Bacteroidota bacterium]MBL6943456.1 4Fe-4S ferredoxin [Bacteroidales bacterium]
MKRDIIHIDENLCDGCGDCVPNCHEGALQIIDGKARLVSDLMCDGLGACVGHCPQGAITMENREAEPYDEIAVIKEMIPKGRNLIVAHLSHLKEHGETDFLQQGVGYLESVRSELPFDLDDAKREVHHSQQAEVAGCGGGCPSSIPVDLADRINPAKTASEVNGKVGSALTQWPVQMHLINPEAGYFQGADLLFAADCVAFSKGDFHQNDLPGKKLVIACPKLDSGLESYVEKVKVLIENAKINTITVMVMEVPCCSGLLKIVKTAADSASRKVPVKAQLISIKGEVLNEEWI